MVLLEEEFAGSEKLGLAPKVLLNLWSREKLYTPPPPSPHFWPKGIFKGRGVGVYILRPHAAGILYAPPFLIYTPPTPRRVFSGEGGWACIKFGPVFGVLCEGPSALQTCTPVKGPSEAPLENKAKTEMRHSCLQHLKTRYTPARRDRKLPACP